MPPLPHDPTPPRCPRICLACHGGRLASLLETASAFRSYHVEAGQFLADAVWPMPAGGLSGLAALLARSGVELLVCGGATCCCLAPFVRYGIAVAPWIAGDVPTVIAALAQNRLDTLLAPGASPGRRPTGRRGRLPGRPGCGGIHTEYEPS